jgi:hypothetical protein
MSSDMYVVEIPADPNRHTVDTDQNILHRAGCVNAPANGYTVEGADLDHEEDAHFIAWHRHPSGRLFHLNPCGTCMGLSYDELIHMAPGPLE